MARKFKKNRDTKPSTRSNPRPHEKNSRPEAGRGVFVDRSGKPHAIKAAHGKGRAHEERPTERPTHAPHSRVVRPRTEEKPKFSPRSSSGRSGPARPPGDSKKHSHGRGHKRPHERSTPKTGRDFKVETFKAIVDKNQKGFAFLLLGKKGVEDIYVPADQARDLFQGDRVEVTLASSGDILQLKVLEHRFKQLVGRYLPQINREGQRAGWIVYEKKRAREQVPLAEIPKNAQPGDWLRARLEFSPGKRKGSENVLAHVLQVYGKDLPASSDVEVIAAEYNLTEEHPDAVVLEAEGHRLEVPGKDLEGREDLRDVPFITIDGETARDFDDAVYVEKSGKDFILWVAIADVSHYVTEGSLLDQDARSRGTSVYFPERAFHMLPRALSEGLCSLRPNEPRLAMVAKIKLDVNGKKLHTDIYNAVIQSKRRATYNEIEAEKILREKDPTWEYQVHHQLYQVLRKARQNRGSIDFDLPETEIIVAPDGEPTEIKRRERLDAHRLIEEFMIAANEAVTEWMLKRHWPFLYRTHDYPSMEALERFSDLAKTVGIDIGLSDHEKNVPPSVLAEAARKIAGHPAETLLNTTLLRSMKQAIYSSLHAIHYGLASEAYTHFTSPIRRYPDLVVHRMLRRALLADKDPSLRPKGKHLDQLEKDLAEIAEHCSYRERLASDAERESIKLKQVRHMTKHLGEEFDATIIGMIDRGMFAQLQSPFVEGMISRDSMTDDFYEFNEDRMIYYGKRKRRTFKIGDAIRIQCLRADIERRQVDFALIDSVKPT